MRAAAVVGIAWAAGAAIFFRDFLLSGFDLVPGDRLDARLIVYIHEHLFQWLLGNARLTSPDIYHPQANVLGYSDAFLLDLLPYSAFRMMGLDPYLSIMTMFLALSGLCFVCVTILLNGFLRANIFLALAGAILITFPNNLYFKTESGHLQFFTLYYIPGIILLGLWSVKDFPKIASRSVAGVAATSTLFALLLATGYYTAWMFAMTALLAITAIGVARRHDVFRFLALNARPLAILFGFAAAGFAIGLIPFVLIYLPVVRIFPSRPFQEFILRAPGIGDMANVSAWNLVWGSLASALLGGARAGNPELALAITPGMTLAFLAFAQAAMRGKLDDGANSPRTHLYALAGLSVLLGSWLLTLKVGAFSGFWIAFQTLPGAGAIRAGERVQLVANLWVASALVLMIHRWIAKESGASCVRRYLLSGVILALCIVEQLNLRENELSRSTELAELGTVPAPPLSCQSFLMKKFGPVREVDAMWISLETGLPTLNGRSGGAPPGWGLGDSAAGYVAAARLWITRKKLSERVCTYDETTREWAFF